MSRVAGRIKKIERKLNRGKGVIVFQVRHGQDFEKQMREYLASGGNPHCTFIRLIDRFGEEKLQRLFWQRIKYKGV